MFHILAWHLPFAQAEPKPSIQSAKKMAASALLLSTAGCRTCGKGYYQMRSPTVSKTSSKTRPHNRILGALSTREYAAFARVVERVSLHAGEVISEPLEHDGFFYFPETAVHSLVVELSDGRVVEAATVGNEGVSGLAPFLGRGNMTTRCIVQISGEGNRIPVSSMTAFVKRMPRLGVLMGLYTQGLINQLAQSAACNSAHTIQERCARWLLMTHDRVGGAESFDLTQDFLSYMLGVRREAVSGASRVLKRDGIIRYARGHVSIVDRGGLEAAACECYAVTRDDFRRLFAS